MAANRVPYRRILATATALVVTLAVGACSGEQADRSGPGEAPSRTLAEPDEAPTLNVRPVTSSGRLVGRLSRKDRRQVEGSISGAAVRWLEAAYLGGNYPRRNFRNSFGVFTRSARAAARADLDRMTNARIGNRVTAVTPTRLRVRVDLLAVGGRAVSGTAHVDTRFRTDGRADRAYRVAGRLMMTRQDHQWRVFAYDVARARVDGKQKNRGRGGRA